MLLFYWVVWFLIIEFWEFFICTQHNSSTRYVTGKHFLKSCDLFFSFSLQCFSMIGIWMKSNLPFFHINEDHVNVFLDLKSGFKVTNTFSWVFIWKHTEALSRSMIHFELIFMWCDVEIKLICFAYGYAIAPDSNFKKTIISLPIFLRMSVDNQFVYMCMCFPIL